MRKREALKKARGRLRQKEVANSIGINNKLLSALETGRINPSLNVAYKLSKYYNTPIEDLFPDLIDKNTDE